MKKESQFAAFFGINKYGRAGAVATVAILLALVASLLINALVGLLPYSIAKPTVTGLDTFDLSGTTVDWLQTLDEDVTLYLICDGGKAAADNDIYGFLLRYEENCDHICVEVVDPKESADFVSTYTTEQLESMSLIVKSKTRYKVIPATNLFYYYNSQMDMQMTAEEYQYAMETFSGNEAYLEYLATFVETTTAYFDGESRVTNALNFVTRDDVPVVYALTGSGASELDASLKTLLSDTCYDMRTTLTLAELPDDCDLLVINAPSTDLSEPEATALSEYLAADGKLLLTTYYSTAELPNLEGVLAAYGLGTKDEINVVMEGHTNYALSDSSGVYPYFYKAHIDREHAATVDFEDDFLLYYSHAIMLTETEGVTQTNLLYTSAAAYLKSYDAESKKWTDAEEKGKVTVGVMAEKGGSKILWISSPDALTSKVNSSSANSGNFNFILSTMNYMSGVGSDSIAIESAMLDTSLLSATAIQALIWGIVLVIVLPVSLAVAGIVVWYMRKKR